MKFIGLKVSIGKTMDGAKAQQLQRANAKAIQTAESYINKAQSALRSLEAAACARKTKEAKRDSG